MDPRPDALAEHSAIAIGSNIYIFGGRTQYEVVNSMWKLQVGTVANRYNETSW